jgi:uncharacterized protein (TIGR00369 family)
MIDVLDGSLFGENQPCFGCSPTHPHGFHLSFVREGDGVVTRFTPTAVQQGPPGIMHGGLVMTLADEIGAWAILAEMGKFGFTASAECKFRAPVRIGIELIGRGRISKPGRRIVDTAVTITQNDKLCTEATLRFALLDRGAAEQMIGGKLSEEWARFSR